MEAPHPFVILIAHWRFVAMAFSTPSRNCVKPTLIAQEVKSAIAHVGAYPPRYVVMELLNLVKTATISENRPPAMQTVLFRCAATAS